MRAHCQRRIPAILAAVALGLAATGALAGPEAAGPELSSQEPSQCRVGGPPAARAPAPVQDAKRIARKLSLDPFGDGDVVVLNNRGYGGYESIRNRDEVAAILRREAAEQGAHP